MGLLLSLRGGLSLLTVEGNVQIGSCDGHHAMVFSRKHCQQWLCAAGGERHSRPRGNGFQTRITNPCAKLDFGSVRKSALSIVVLILAAATDAGALRTRFSAGNRDSSWPHFCALTAQGENPEPWPGSRFSTDAADGVTGDWECASGTIESTWISGECS
jgi:hypothetical protein